MSSGLMLCNLTSFYLKQKSKCLTSLVFSSSWLNSNNNLCKTGVSCSNSKLMNKLLQQQQVRRCLPPPHTVMLKLLSRDPRTSLARMEQTNCLGGRNYWLRSQSPPLHQVQPRPHLRGVHLPMRGQQQLPSLPRMLDG